MSSNDSRQMKTCSGCAQELPLSSFRRRRSGEDRRVAQCNACHRRYMAEFRAARRHRDFTRILRDASRLRDVEKVTVLVKAALAKFGGVDGFTHELKVQYDAAVAERPGSENVRLFLMAVIGLIETSSRIEAGHR